MGRWSIQPGYTGQGADAYLGAEWRRGEISSHCSEGPVIKNLQIISGSFHLIFRTAADHGAHQTSELLFLQQPLSRGLKPSQAVSASHHQVSPLGLTPWGLPAPPLLFSSIPGTNSADRSDTFHAPKGLTLLPALSSVFLAISGVCAGSNTRYQDRRILQGKLCQHSPF